MAISDQDLTSVLGLIHQVDDPQHLSAISTAIQLRREALNRRAIYKFRVGERVSYMNSKTGQLTFGTIRKIKVKWVEVTTETANGIPGQTWNVTAGQLKLAPKGMVPQ